MTSVVSDALIVLKINGFSEAVAEKPDPISAGARMLRCSVN
jgi:hypothetical protein